MHVAALKECTNLKTLGSCQPQRGLPETFREKPSHEDPEPSKKEKRSALSQAKFIAKKTSSKGKQKASLSKEPTLEPPRKRKLVVESNTSSKDSAEVKYNDDLDDSLEESGEDYDDQE